MIWGISGFFIGIILRSYLELGNSLVLFLILLAFTFIVVAKLEKDKFYFSTAILLIFIGLGIGRYNLINPPKIISKVDVVTIIDEPEETDSYIRYRVKTDQGDKLLVYSKSNEVKYEYGDKLKISGKVTKIENNYWAKDEIYYQVYNPKLNLVSHDNGNWLQSKLFALKHSFLSNISKEIAEPESSLAGGLVVGAKESMGKDLLDKFRISGLIHMVVLSGYNISIVALGVMWLLRRRFSLKVSTLAGIITIILFAIMVGGGATVLRASIMASLALVANATGRINQVTRALLLAAILMILYNPKLLVFDTGFQLSFLATLGLIYLEPIFRPHFTWLPETILKFKFREIASTTLAAQLAVFPLILYVFGNFSVYAFPVNLLVLPLVPLAMLLIFLTGIFAFIPVLNLLSYPLAWLSYILLAYFISLVKLVSHLPLANLSISHIPLFLVILMYCGLVFLVWYHRPKQNYDSQISPR